MVVVAGCDGGGTKCTVRLAILDEANQVVKTSQVSTGPANVRTDPELAMQSICLAADQAVVASGLPAKSKIHRFVAALAGAGKQETRAAWQQTLSEVGDFESVEVIPDILALFAASDQTRDRTQVPAIATVVGTGSIAWARLPDSRMVRAGGLGPEVGDEGSGYWIAKQAMQRADRESPLGEKFAECFPGDQLSTADIARKSSWVFELAGEDPIADEILSEAVWHIAQIIVEVVAALPSVTNMEQVPWICAGGVAVNQPVWLESVREQVVAQGILLRRPDIVVEPVAGALELARRSVTNA